jgi:malate synthase
MGGMAAQIPIKDDPIANGTAIDKVIADKEREAGDGHDGTWVAHPGMVGLAKQVFDEGMPKPNQVDRLREEVSVTAAALLEAPAGTRTEAGLRHNIRVGIQYLEAWLGGQGAVPIYNLMEDAATAEISRTQVWQWVRHGAHLSDGRVVTRELVESIIEQEMQEKTLRGGKFELAARLFAELMTGSEFPEFLTLVAYEHLE